ncbi:UNVERIFIED_CONTAM: hypothetical protein FKN15_021224 [Acipenser sinensis]
MASLCKRQQCTIERRGFRQDLDSWRHKLIHCVDCEPEGVSDWSFNKNCLFCCLRREKVKEHLAGLDKPALEAGEKALCKQEQSKIHQLEKQAEEFLHAVFYRKDVPRVSDPHIPLVAREIMQRMIRQFAAEYTSKTSSSQDHIQPNGTKDQSLPKAPSLASAAASAQNPVLSKLLMADQDSPLDLTVKKSESESSDQDCEPEGVSDWSFNKNCLFCCLRREKVKEHLAGLDKPALEAGEKALCKQEQSKIHRLEKQAEEFLHAVFYRKDVPRVSDPHIPLVAREIMQRMIRQFAAEYTSKTSSSQDPIQPNGTKDQSLPKAPSLASAAASAQNPVLSKLLMADQDSPLDLTVKKSESESSDQAVQALLTPISFHSIRRPGRADHNHKDGHSRDADGLPQRSLQDGTRESYGHSSPLKPPLARSLQIKEELQNRKQQQPPVSLASLESMGLLKHGQRSTLSRQDSWSKPRFDNHLKFRGNSALNDLKDLPFLLENSVAYHKGSTQTKLQEGKRDPRNSAPVDLKIPQVRGMDLSWDSRVSDLYGYGSLVVGPHSESALSKKLRAILPKQNRRTGCGGILERGADFWGSDAEQSTSGQQYPTSDTEGDPNSKQPRKKRGRYRQYNSEILEEAISVVMNGKMSVSKAQNIYGIPHSTLEYKVKERLGTLKNPPKKKMKLSSMEGQESDPLLRGEGSQGARDSKDE